MATQSSYPSIAAAKGLAISASLLTSGSLATVSLISLPGMIHRAESSHRIAAQQFARVYNAGKAIQTPLEIVATAAFGFLAWYSHRQIPGIGNRWKLYAGAAGAMFAVIPFTFLFMEEASQKLVRLAIASEKEGKAPEVTITSEPTLSIPNLSGDGSGLMTPSEEFEPFDDSPFSTEEYEMGKTRKLLRQYSTLSAIRTLGPLVAGGFGLWAILT